MSCDNGSTPWDPHHGLSCSTFFSPDYDRAGRIGEFYQDPRTRTFAELLIDAEEDRYVRAVLVGLLREIEAGWYPSASP